MAKPTDTLPWATDPGATSDPGPTRKATGFLAGKRLPAKWLNYLLNKQGAWFQYLANLHDESEFLNKNYTWTGQTTFAGTTRLASGVEISYPAPVARARQLIMPPTGNWTAMGFAFGITPAAIKTLTASAQTTLRVELPHGSIITGLRARMSQANVATGVAQAMRLFLLREKPDDTGGVTDLETVASVDTNNVPGFQAPVVTGLSHVVDNASYYYLRLVSSDAAPGGEGNGDQFYSTTVLYEEPKLVIY